VKVRRRTLLGALLAAPLLPRAALATPETVERSYPVRTLEPVWIPVGGGVKLAARLWSPDGAPGERFPVVFEYIPYRTFDRYRGLDDRWGETLAAHGIAFVRVDIRGSGNSEGLLRDEYLASEQGDGVEVIAWLAAQPWCNGSVGMRGISWGGFSTLQVAALRPPALKAIMPMCATDMRFRNDAHYVGGRPGLTNLKWAAGFELVMSGPPDPAVVGARWEAMWRDRLAATPSIAAEWLRHDHNDAYWRHGSVGLAPSAITCPTYLVDGWADSYAQSAERLLRSLRVPKKALFGPWGHAYPDLGQPGPSLDWAYEEVRWWRRWLSQEPNSIMEGPLFRFYVDYATPAETGMREIPGRWAAEDAWPSPRTRELRLHLAPGRLAPSGATGRVRYRAEKVVGLASPEWIPYAAAELPRDQRPDDDRSLVFDLAITEPLEIVGVPALRLRVSSDRPLASVAARLCEVDREGRSWLVTYGLLNLCFRDGFEADPKRLKPGEAYDVELALDPIAHRFKPGSTLRLALSDSLWPLVWPAPETPTLEFDLQGCRLQLPVRPVPATETAFPIPVHHSDFSRGAPRLEIEERPKGSVQVRGAWANEPYTLPATSTTLSGAGPDMELDFDPSDPNSCRWRVTQSSRYQRGDWDCETRVEIEMTSTPTHYVIQEKLVALKGGKPFFEADRRDEIKRRFS
jgi:uncharacterized protein